jgi:uncharacterized protein (DUF697 family)
VLERWRIPFAKIVVMYMIGIAVNTRLRAMIASGATPSHRMGTSVPMQVMGMLQGKVIKDTFIVVDTFALPVEGTETRVNAAEGAYEYLATYPETAKVSHSVQRETRL